MFKKTKEIPLKNYVILGLIIIGVIALVYYFNSLYQTYAESKFETPVIRDTLSEITNEELDHYIIENPSSVLYMCTSKDQACRTFEKNFKKLIEKDELQDYIIYVNLSNIDRNEFVDNFNNSYSKEDNLKLTKNYPAIIIMKDGYIHSIMEEDEPLDITDVKYFLKANNVTNGE